MEQEEGGPMAVEVFGFAHDPRFALQLRVFGVTPSRAWVRVDERRLAVRYGFFFVEVPLANVSDARVSGPYEWYRAIGPRLSLTDLGATYGTTAAGGVCIRFHEPVRALRPLANPSLTVTVADPEGLAAAIRERRRALPT
jgi:hypothetical protein